jgi:hypothetical protein
VYATMRDTRRHSRIDRDQAMPEGQP